LFFLGFKNATAPDHDAGTNTNGTGERGTEQGKEPRVCLFFFLLNLTNVCLLIDFAYGYHHHHTRQPHPRRQPRRWPRIANTTNRRRPVYERAQTSAHKYIYFLFVLFTSMRSINWVEVLGLGDRSGVLEKFLEKYETRPSESSESSTFQHFQHFQQYVIFLMGPQVLFLLLSLLLFY
jgi:hypothetical protein